MGRSQADSLQSTTNRIRLWILILGFYVGIVTVDSAPYMQRIPAEQTLQTVPACMDIKEVLETLYELNPNALTADGFDAACVGYTTGFGPTLAVYDRSKFIKILIERDGMTPEGAEEHMAFNVEGAFVGEGTPVFIETGGNHFGDSGEALPT